MEMSIFLSLAFTEILHLKKDNVHYTWKKLEYKWIKLLNLVSTMIDKMWFDTLLMHFSWKLQLMSSDHPYG